MRIALFIASLCLAVPLRASVIYVDQDAPGAQDGTSWSNAYPDLQSALAAAIAGDEIHVAQGTYRPDAGSGDRTLSFELESGVTVYGGYAGYGEIRPDQRLPILYRTILSGDLNDDDATVGTAENSYHVVSASAVDATARLDGFVIRDGHADGSMADDRGAGLYLYDSSPVIFDCRFLENVASDTGLVGGGAVCNVFGSPELGSCTFRRNAAGFGGAITDYFGSAVIADSTFTSNSAANTFYANGCGGAISAVESTTSIGSCEFDGNEATDANGGGGAVFCNDAVVTITECTFTENTSADQGGAVYDFQSETEISSCTFTGNSAEYGGAIADADSTLTLSECTLTGNQAFDGAGLYTADGSTDVQHCSFEGNIAEDAGGGIYLASGDHTIRRTRLCGNAAGVAGGVAVFNSAAAELINSILSGNTAEAGAGLVTNSTALTSMLNCTFSRNAADTVAGGVLRSMGTSIAIDNSIFWENSDDGGATTDEQAQIAFGSSAAGVSIAFSCVQNLTGTMGGSGNIDGNPRFMDQDGADGVFGTLDDDLRLQLTSACIDAGTNFAIVRIPIDVDGNARRSDCPTVADTGRGTKPIVDMGAHERSGLIVR